MRKLCLGLSFVAMAVLAACGGDNGSSAGDIGESSSSSEIDMIESCASVETPSSSSEKAESNTSEDSSSSEPGESNSSDSKESSSSSEEIGEESSSSEGFSESSSSSEEESGSSEEPESSSEDASSASEEPESSGSEGVEGSSASVPGGSSDASVYDADKNTLKDLRDGQIYKTTTIDIPSKSYSEVWMAENLNYAYTGVPFDNGYYTSDSTSWCYDNDPANCAKYGRLYTWAAAMDSVGEWSTNGKGCGYGKKCSVASAGSATLVRGICPKGWHLPSNDEWESLIVAVDGSITGYRYSNTAGTKLKSQTGWYDNGHGTNGNGTDAFGFSALPAGCRDYDGSYTSEGGNANFWSSTEDGSYRAYNMDLHYGYDRAYLGINTKELGFSVRCLKD